MSRPSATSPAGGQRRAEILSKVADMLADETFRDMKMDSVAEAIGVAKSTLYYYFPKKDDILFELIRDTQTTLITLFNSKSTLSPAEQVRECLSDMVRLTAAAPGRHNVLYEQKHNLLPAQRVELDRLERDYFGLVSSTIKQAVGQGEFRELDAEIVTQGLIGMVAHARHWYSPGGRLNATQIADQFWSVFFEGVRRP